MTKECLLHDTVNLDHLKKLANVEVSVELLNSTVQVEVGLAMLVPLQALLLSHESTMEIVFASKACAVTQLALVQNRVEDVGERLAIGAMAH